MTKAAHRIMQGLREAAAHARGEKVPGLNLHIPRVVNVSAVRRRTGLSQAAFSRQIGVSPGTLRNWEQGRRAPEGPARVLLAMLSYAAAPTEPPRPPNLYAPIAGSGFRVGLLRAGLRARTWPKPPELSRH